MIPQVPAHKSIVVFIGLALFACAAAHADPAAIQALIDQDKNQQALSASDEYLSSHADDADARFLRGIALARLGKTDAAIDVFGTLARENPQTPEYANNLAVLYAQKGEYEKARRWLEAAMSTHPAYATAHRNLGDVYTALAAQAYSKALDQQGGSADLGVQLEFVTKLYDTPDGATSATVIAQTEPAAAPAPVQPEPEPQPRIVKAPKPKPEPARPPQPSEPVVAPEPQPAAPSAPEVAAVPEPTAPAEPEVVAEPAPEIEPAPQPSAPAPSVAEQAPSSPAVATPPPASGEAGKVEQTVRRWAKVWSDQDVQAYLNSYAENFYPGDNQNLAQWRRERSERVSAPGHISVELVNLKVRIGEDGRARATFQQNYSADSYSDKVTKTLILERKDNTWRIVRESSAPL